MMKNLFIFLATVVLGLIGWLLYRSMNYYEASYPMNFDVQPPSVKTEVVQTGSGITGHVINVGSYVTGELPSIDTSKIPECRNSLKETDIIDMDKVVRNCKEKKKEGRTVDGLGGAYPEYALYNEEVGLLIYDDYEKKDILCKHITQDKQTFYYERVTSSGKNEFANIPVSQLEPMQRVSKLGLLKFIAYPAYGDKIYCGEGVYSELAGGTGIDADCEDMHEAWATSDTGYYFVAGYNDEVIGAPLYVINDRIYSPGKRTHAPLNDGFAGIGDYSDGYNEKHLGQGIRQFVAVRNNKIIVKRMKDEKINMKKKDSNDMNTTIYTLQTCEIPL